MSDTNIVQPGALYRHYKGKYYKVLGVARHSETLEELVVYQSLYETPQFAMGQFWVRPKAMFLEDVVVDGKKVRRFSQINPDEHSDLGLT